MNLIHLKEKAAQKKRFENLLQKTKAELEAEIQKSEELAQQLKKELKDVTRLEEPGLQSMFYEFLGTIDKKLDKERQEYLAAKLKLENCKKVISDLKDEVEKLEKELENCGTPEEAYQQLLEEKKSGLKALNDDKFVKYEELLQYFYSQKREVKEAIDAGEMALKGLTYAIKSLRNASGWGTVDMIGGGLLTTAIKHSKMDEAKGLIHDVQFWLRKFNRELGDVSIQEINAMDIKLDGFLSFADYFFDNLITDWVVQSKINRSLEGCENVYRQVKDILVKLKSTDGQLTNKYKNTKTEFTTYIENT